MSGIPAGHRGGDILPLLRAAFQHSSLGIAFYDRDLRFIAVNGVFAALSGVSAAGHEGRRLDEILPQYAQQIAPCLRSVFASGRSLTGVALSGIRPQGVPKAGHWLVTYEPVIEHDTVTAVVVLVADVTAQRRSDAILATQREVLERCVLGEPLAEVLDRVTNAVTEHSVDRALASILLLENGRLTHCSAPHLPRAYVEAIDGLPIGPSAGSCGTAAYRREPVIVRDIEHDPVWEAYRHVALSHGLRACWSVPIIGSGDEVLGTFALYHRTVCDPSPDDVWLTSLMARTAALLIEWWGGEEARQRLLVEEQRARKVAEDANSGKDEFVAMLSHELRTPLNAVIGWTRMLRTANGDAALTDRALNAIERNAEAQERLIADLLDIARIARGGLRLEISEVDLRVVALAAIDAVGPLADAKGLRLVADLPERAVPLDGDPTRLRQVIWNLLTNAVKFTPAGGDVRLEVRSLPDGAHVVVRDTGIGIPGEILPQIFDRYRQGDPSTGGLGLGLAIASSVARLHGGSLRASSDGPGRGAQFELVLPSPLAARAPLEMA